MRFTTMYLADHSGHRASQRAASPRMGVLVVLTQQGVHSAYSRPTACERSMRAPWFARTGFVAPSFRVRDKRCQNDTSSVQSNATKKAGAYYVESTCHRLLPRFHCKLGLLLGCRSRGMTRRASAAGLWEDASGGSPILQGLGGSDRCFGAVGLCFFSLRGGCIVKADDR